MERIYIVILVECILLTLLFKFSGFFHFSSSFELLSEIIFLLQYSLAPYLSLLYCYGYIYYIPMCYRMSNTITYIYFIWLLLKLFMGRKANKYALILCFVITQLAFTLLFFCRRGVGLKYCLALLTIYLKNFL